MSRVDKNLSQKQEALLADLFMGQFPDPYKNPRMDKARSLYKLAVDAQGGVIVELGTFHGCGAISLAWGTSAGHQLPVFTIDDYVDKPDWIGTDRFGPQDREKFWSNVHLAGMGGKIELLEIEANAALKYWTEGIPSAPIALLFWDLGGTRLFDDFIRWHSQIAPGGLFAIHDTGDKKFGTDKVVSLALASGSWEYEGNIPGFIYLLRRI